MAAGRTNCENAYAFLPDITIAALPAPLGPMIATLSPASTSNFRFWITLRLSNLIFSACTERTMPVVNLLPFSSPSRSAHARQAFLRLS